MKLKIGYFAEGLWGTKGIEPLLNDSDIQVCFIYSKGDYSGILSQICAEKDIPLYQNESINTPDFLQKIRKYECDLFISVCFNQIFKAPIINTPRLATINWHAGKLPFYRGRNILNWALINDEREFGITVHYMDEGIDTGDIITQRVFAINDEDNYASLFARITKLSAEVLYEAVVKFKNGKPQGIKQNDIHPTGFYCSYRKAGDEKLCFYQTSREVFNFVRALAHPAVMARAMLNGHEMKINKVELIKDAPNYKCAVGAILQKDTNGFLVKTADSFVRVSEFEFCGKFSVGDRFDD
ncbi:methionyl-tRNA formyltransferase [Campylobacter mucosalis]|uniref:Formyltransferase domain-containing protein n=1 Tax=Campylobacter mucosalis CCUG 21559 TaxID=1032067 RepID=A0A6G5QE80_9BACT|nr:methionyl-tRNA formyltransferase [Campylobacter mucosalis]QCD44013.1 formyltransferase domain-containing protein [Campylobacter mucosalis CCUG 21559]